MNTKRQTIWLVSIFGLMVVLSAYYLLSSDMRSIDGSDVETNRLLQRGEITDGTMPVTEVKVDIEPTDVHQDTDASSTHSTPQDYFMTMQMKRHEDLRKKTEHLMGTIADHKQQPEAVAAATHELENISDMQEKIDHLEEELLRDFPQAVIVQEGDYWRVSIQAKKLEKSQGVSIIDKMINELQIKPEHIKLQWIKP
jgi:stage III sporulation protein AH